MILSQKNYGYAYISIKDTNACNSEKITTRRY